MNNTAFDWWCQLAGTFSVWAFTAMLWLGVISIAGNMYKAWRGWK